MASEIDQQFIEYVVKSLVGKPDKVQIERRIDEKGVLLELTVDPEDLGRVIGKRGATAQSLRTLLRALGTKNDARYNLKIVDNGTGPPRDSAVTTTESTNDAPADTPADVATSEAEADESSAPNDDIGAESAETTELAAAEPTEESSEPEDKEQTSDRLRRTREELADLDDLDV